MTTTPPTSWTASTLGRELHASRQRTLALFQRLQAGLGPSGQPRYLPELSPPLWDLGHLAWFEGWWLARNPGLMAGERAEGELPRAPSNWLPHADAWFDDRLVNHPARWNQPLPPAPVVLDWARRTREQTLALLPAAARRDAALALFTRVLDAEDRLHEDWLAMAQTLGIDPGGAADDPATLPAQEDAGTGIDAQPVTWARMLAFVDDGGYARPECWSAEGWNWRKRAGLTRPRHLAAPDADEAGPLRRARFGQWVPLDVAQAAMHLSWYEAEAWCRWAGRRLPSAAEWRAAQAGSAPFAWGEVWEWVAGDGPGEPPQLIGGSFATAPRLKRQPATRASAADRNDAFAGFRTCPPAAA